MQKNTKQKKHITQKQHNKHNIKKKHEQTKQNKHNTKQQYKKHTT